MASLERRGRTFRVVFMHAGRKRGFSLDTDDKQTAEALCGGVEKTLMMVRQGLLPLPEGADLVAFVRAGGKAAEVPKPQPAASTFGQLRDLYLEAHRHGAMEASSLATLELHFRHLADTLGERFAIARVSLSDLQGHVNRRLGQRHHGRRIGPVTVRKEITTLRTAWNWGVPHGIVSGALPAKGLVYPKTDEKPPFMTLEEVERKVASGGLAPAERAKLYESLYLRKEEIEGLLAHTKTVAAHPWVYPLVCTAAHTGARRSELIRMEVSDLDMANGTLLVHEKKRSKKQRTTRHVSLSPFLKDVLRDWMAVHPGGRFLFSQNSTVARSKKRSATTGHQWGGDRAKTKAGRAATVAPRQSSGPLGITKDEASDHLTRTLARSRWQAVRGFHVLRHSFISCLAAAGVDQRIIDEFVGHCSEEQRKRYRHLTPDVRHKAIAGAFS